jgi:hypothetical protein
LIAVVLVGDARRGLRDLREYSIGERMPDEHVFATKPI